MPEISIFPAIILRSRMRLQLQYNLALSPRRDGRRARNTPMAGSG